MSETIQQLETSSRKPRKLAKGLKLLLGLFLTYLAARILLSWFPPGPHLTCNRAIEGSIDQWRLESKTNGFPNARGEAVASLQLIMPFMTPGSLRDYGYVPGLQPDDAQELVLFYVKEPSRKRWHGDGWSPFQTKLWIVVNPQFSGSYEDAEAITTIEFRRRLAKTLEFLESNRRPGSTNAANEHRKLLESLQAR